jgi:hypothetical protein
MIAHEAAAPRNSAFAGSSQRGMPPPPLEPRGTEMQSEKGAARLREHAEELFDSDYEKAMRTAREAREADLEALRAKAARLRAARGPAAGGASQSWSATTPLPIANHLLGTVGSVGSSELQNTM